MAILWPSNLPLNPLLAGYAESIPSNVLRTQMDAGPAKTRRRSAAKPWSMSVSFSCTNEQAVTLSEFVQDTIKGGALRFEWTHPRTGANIECRIVPEGEKIVSLEPMGCGNYWLASMTMEVLP